MRRAAWVLLWATAAMMAGGCGRTPAAPAMASDGGEPGATAQPEALGAEPGPGPGTASGPPRPATPGRASAGCGEAHPAGDFVGEWEGHGFRLHVPGSHGPRRPAALVLNFHGYAQDAAQQEAYSGLVPVSDEEGFVLVTPEGSGHPQGWDIVGVYNDDGTDDVTFVRGLVADIAARVCIDTGRVFATGHSNGGEMAAQLACFAPDLVAAVAPVSGVVYQGCDGPAVPLLSFQGTWDENVPYEDTAPDMERWAAHNGCGTAAETEWLTAHVRREAWPDCGGADVVFYVIEEAGHTWPGAPIAGGAGPASDEVEASRVMWAFFAAHGRP